MCVLRVSNSTSYYCMTVFQVEMSGILDVALKFLSNTLSSTDSHFSDNQPRFSSSVKLEWRWAFSHFGISGNGKAYQLAVITSDTPFISSEPPLLLDASEIHYRMEIWMTRNYRLLDSARHAENCKMINEMWNIDVNDILTGHFSFNKNLLKDSHYLNEVLNWAFLKSAMYNFMSIIYHQNIFTFKMPCWKQ